MYAIGCCHFAGDDYYARFDKTGYLSSIINNIDAVKGVTTTLTTLMYISEEYSGAGAAEGTIINALNGSGVDGLTINFRSGFNTISGDIIITASTTGGGAYSISTDAGLYTGEITGSGYQTAYFNIYIIGGRTTGSQDGVISPALNPGETRIVLTWGATPVDSRFSPVRAPDRRVKVPYILAAILGEI